MFQRPRNPYPGGFPPQRMNPFMGRSNYPDMYRMGRQIRPRRQQRGGGLLAKLFSQKNQMGAFNSFTGAGRSMGATSASSTGGGLLRTLANPNSISGFLTNTQKVLNTAQQIGPIVQQYGPIVRNIPTMWKLYRGLKNLPTNSEDEKTPEESGDITQNHETFENSTNENQTIEIRQSKGNSIPKLYI